MCVWRERERERETETETDRQTDRQTEIETERKTETETETDTETDTERWCVTGAGRTEYLECLIERTTTKSPLLSPLPKYIKNVIYIYEPVWPSGKALGW